MTREEATKMLRREIECLSHSKCEDCILEKACDPMRTPLDSKYIEAFEISIKALEQESCDDCISRQAAIRAIEALQLPIMRETDAFYQFKFSGMSEAKEAVENLPSVSPQQKVGRWVVTDDDLVYCSECEDSYYPRPIDASWYYCPHCGAKMEVEE